MLYNCRVRTAGGAEAGQPASNSRGSADDQRASAVGGGGRPGVWLRSITSSNIHGEPADKTTPVVVAAAAVPRPVPRSLARRPRPTTRPSSRKTRFSEANLLTYQPLEGDLQFALQVKPSLPKTPVRDRDYLIMVSVSANQAGPGLHRRHADRRRAHQERPTHRPHLAVDRRHAGEADDPLPHGYSFLSVKDDAKKLKAASDRLQVHEFPAGDTDLKSGLNQAIKSFEDVDNSPAHPAVPRRRRQHAQPDPDRRSHATCAPT